MPMPRIRGRYLAESNMTQGKTVCECGRDDIHSSKDCLTLEKLLDKWKDVLDYKPSEESEGEQKERLKNTVLIESEKFHPIDGEEA